MPKLEPERLPVPRINREESRKRTVEKLRRSAVREFAASGVGGAAIDRISERAGFSRGAFYANFRSKDEILLDIIRERNASELEKWRALLAYGNDIDAIIAGVARNFADYIANAQQGLFIAELQLYAKRNPRFAKKYRACVHEAESVTRELLAASFRAARRTPPMDVGQIASLTRSMVLGLVLDTSEDDISAADAAAQHLELWLRSIIAQGTPVQD